MAGEKKKTMRGRKKTAETEEEGDGGNRDVPKKKNENVAGGGWENSKEGLVLARGSSIARSRSIQKDSRKMKKNKEKFTEKHTKRGV